MVCTALLIDYDCYFKDDFKITEANTFPGIRDMLLYLTYGLMV